MLLARMISLQLRIQLSLAQDVIRTVPPSRLWNYARNRWAHRSEVLDVNRRAPRTFACLVTRRCNLRCPWCLTPAIHDKHFDLTTEVFDRFLAHPAVRNCLLVAFTGGEPLLNRDLATMVAHARSDGHLASMTTNGLNLDGRIEELKLAGINMINVSVYNSNVSALANTLPRTNRTFRVRMNKIILRRVLEENPGEIEEAIRMSVETGCLGTALYLCLPHDGGIEDVVYDDHAAYADFKRRIRAKYPKHPIAWPKPAKRNLGSMDKICQFPWSTVIADAHGDLGPCCNYYPDPAKSYGNLLENGSAEVLNGPLFLELRRGLLAPDPALPACCKGCYAMSEPWYSKQ
jgi:hypothetical protein